MVEKNVFSKFKVYCLKRMTLAAGFSFLFACPKRNKKDPSEGLHPLRRKQLCGAVVQSDLRFSFSMLSPDRIFFLFGEVSTFQVIAIRL